MAKHRQFDKVHIDFIQKSLVECRKKGLDKKEVLTRFTEKFNRTISLSSLSSYEKKFKENVNDIRKTPPKTIMEYLMQRTALIKREEVEQQHRSDQILNLKGEAVKENFLKRTDELFTRTSSMIDQKLTEISHQINMETFEAMCSRRKIKNLKQNHLSKFRRFSKRRVF
ncbi:unnamed protein product [Brachionus calyciflorus]|uniref:Uncharacterized protein n=1 Tax=Brachionus calyciflorus TaxID=104777 RepID=A0A813Q5B9_9BILA|nr:unnamed protein product [Brachionus calyciflorus]